MKPIITRILLANGAGFRHAKCRRTYARTIAMRRSTHDITAMLDSHLRRGRFQQLVPTTTPEELGPLRAKLFQAVRKRVSADLNKDPTAAAPKEIRGHLDGVTAV